MNPWKIFGKAVDKFWMKPCSKFPLGISKDYLEVRVRIFRKVSEVLAERFSQSLKKKIKTLEMNELLLEISERIHEIFIFYGAFPKESIKVVPLSLQSLVLHVGGRGAQEYIY